MAKKLKGHNMARVDNTKNKNRLMWEARRMGILVNSSWTAEKLKKAIELKVRKALAVPRTMEMIASATAEYMGAGVILSDPTNLLNEQALQQEAQGTTTLEIAHSILKLKGFVLSAEGYAGVAVQIFKRIGPDRTRIVLLINDDGEICTCSGRWVDDEMALGDLRRLSGT